jgi:hypothetical protein
VRGFSRSCLSALFRFVHLAFSIAGGCQEPSTVAFVGPVGADVELERAVRRGQPVVSELLALAVIVRVDVLGFIRPVFIDVRRVEPRLPIATV